MCLGISFRGGWKLNPARGWGEGGVGGRAVQTRESDEQVDGGSTFWKRKGLIGGKSKEWIEMKLGVSCGASGPHLGFLSRIKAFGLILRSREKVAEDFEARE